MAALQKALSVYDCAEIYCNVYLRQPGEELLSRDGNEEGSKENGKEINEEIIEEKHGQRTGVLAGVQARDWNEARGEGQLRAEGETNLGGEESRQQGRCREQAREDGKITGLYWRAWMSNAPAPIYSRFRMSSKRSNGATTS
jgi:hypothetical protein